MIEDIIRSGIVNIQDIPALDNELKRLGRRLVFIDASFVLPNSGEDIYENYKESHIPGALFFNISDVCDKDCDLPHMLPAPELFGYYMSDMGIKNEDLIIVYGQSGMILGPARLWWMLKGFGHSSVAVLNGGLPAWIQLGLETQNVKPLGFEKSQYQCQPFDSNKVVSIDDMINISDYSTYTILDARPQARFDGTSPEPRDDMRSGHIPNSLSCPSSGLIDESGMIKSSFELEKMFKANGISDDKTQRIVTTCGSGITACALTLALHHIGYTNVAVYDGSWSEWGRVSSPTKIASNV